MELSYRHPSEENKSPEELLKLRNQRVTAALQLKQPDRIPVLLSTGYMLAELGGISKLELYENPGKAQELLEMAAVRFQPDIIKGAWHTPAPSKVLGDRQTQWPGYGLDKNGSFQFQEVEFMKTEDYDAFLEDMADWAIRVYTPRAFSNLQGLSSLPPLGMWLLGYYNTFNFSSFLDADIAGSFEAIAKAAQFTADWIKRNTESARRLAELGFPLFSYIKNQCHAPFDFMSNTLRGFRGIFIDMMRCPEKLLAAEEKVAQVQINFISHLAGTRGATSAFLPLHHGSDSFMSIKEFEKFYWPQLKKMLLAFIETGVTPWIYYEGTWNNRLEYLKELPAGKTIGLFQDSDIFKVKEILGNAMCIIGGMPVSMLINSTPEQVREHTREVCSRAGKNGGFIFHTNIGELEGCNPDLVRVWVDSVKEYGVY
ncbi:MAG: hypothetical protein JW864_18295 [Spirochaetes bacterium]|nr:hypothetical protein [Spirochaetota bacterium]